MDPFTILKRAAASIVEELNSVEHISPDRKVGFAFAVTAQNTINRFSHCLRMASYGNLSHDLKELSNELFFDAPVGLRAKLVTNITALLASDEIIILPRPKLTPASLPSPLRLWRSGLLSPEQCMSAGSDLHINQVLLEGGYGTYEPSPSGSVSPTSLVTTNLDSSTKAGFPLQHTQNKRSLADAMQFRVFNLGPPVCASIAEVKHVNLSSHACSEPAPLISTLTHRGHLIWNYQKQDNITFHVMRDCLHQRMTSVAVRPEEQKYFKYQIGYNEVDLSPVVSWVNNTLTIGARLSLPPTGHLTGLSTLLMVDSVISCDFLDDSGAFVILLEGRFEFGAIDCSTLPADLLEAETPPRFDLDELSPLPHQMAQNSVNMGEFGSLRTPESSQSYQQGNNLPFAGPGETLSDELNSESQDSPNVPNHSPRCLRLMRRRYYCVFGHVLSGQSLARLDSITSLQGLPFSEDETEVGGNAAMDWTQTDASRSLCSPTNTANSFRMRMEPTSPGDGSPFPSPRVGSARRNPPTFQQFPSSPVQDTSKIQRGPRRDQLLLDQVPVQVLLISPALAAVRGTNALLALVTRGCPAFQQSDHVGIGSLHPAQPKDTSSNAQGIKKLALSRVESSSDSDSAAPAPAAAPGFGLFYSLTVDQQAVGVDELSPEEAVHSHAFSSTVSSFSQASGVLYSADSEGVLCAWEMPDEAQLGSNSHADLVFSSGVHMAALPCLLPGGITSLQACPSGRHAVVATSTRLFVAGFAEVQQAASSPAADTEGTRSFSRGVKQQLYLRAQLDCLAGASFAKYHVGFFAQTMSIIRITDLVNEPTGVDFQINNPNANQQGEGGPSHTLSGLTASGLTTAEDDEMEICPGSIPKQQQHALMGLLQPPSRDSAALPQLVNGGIQITTWLHPNIDSCNFRYSAFASVNPFGLQQAVYPLEVPAFQRAPVLFDPQSQSQSQPLPQHQHQHQPQPWPQPQYQHQSSLPPELRASQTPTSEAFFGSFVHVRARELVEQSLEHERSLISLFGSPTSRTFLESRDILCVWAAASASASVPDTDSIGPPPLGLIAAAISGNQYEDTNSLEMQLKSWPLCEILEMIVTYDDSRSNFEDDLEDHLVTVLIARPSHRSMLNWLFRYESDRIGGPFWLDISLGHNMLCALYLKACSNKSIAIESEFQSYLSKFGPYHLRHSNRSLRLLTSSIRKIDETAGIEGPLGLPRQIGFISGLQEIYARRSKLEGRLPQELGELRELRVLSMGNNYLSGQLPTCLTKLTKLQRIVLHQNRLSGKVPRGFTSLGCIVNLAGNPFLEFGPDVPSDERRALLAVYRATGGIRWAVNSHWGSQRPVSCWYKVGVLDSHVHSLVMSSNNLRGEIPSEIALLNHLRMIELATMPELTGPLSLTLCSITSLRRLCICRCGLTGHLPAEIGQLNSLEELQLFGNQFSGKIPDSLGNLSLLKLLSLGEYTGGNPFDRAPIPECISRLHSLEALFLAHCEMVGPIPEWLGTLTELRQLDLQCNNFSGDIPSSFKGLTNLLYLNLKDNRRLGVRKALPIGIFSSMTKLNRLSIVECAWTISPESIRNLPRHLPHTKVWYTPHH